MAIALMTLRLFSSCQNFDSLMGLSGILVRIGYIQVTFLMNMSQ
jgi:hypothetical protein